MWGVERDFFHLKTEPYLIATKITYQRGKSDDVNATENDCLSVSEKRVRAIELVEVLKLNRNMETSI